MVCGGYLEGKPCVNYSFCHCQSLWKIFALEDEQVPCNPGDDLRLLNDAPPFAGGSHHLRGRYYRDKCPQLESVISRAAARSFASNPNVAAGFIMLFFHDCFINVSCLSMRLSVSIFFKSLLSLTNGNCCRVVMRRFSWIPHPQVSL